MPDRVLDKPRQVLRTAREAFVRPLKDGDAVGHGKRIEHAAQSERAAFVESQQCASARHAVARKLRLGRFVFDQDRYVLKPAAEPAGNFFIGFGDEHIERTAIHTSPVQRLKAQTHALLLFYFLRNMAQRRVVVAIDGPAGAGKSTIARRVAEKMGFTYIDSGAMYRAVALWAVRQGIDCGDMHRMEQLALAAELKLDAGRILLNGEDVTGAIRTPEVASAASRAAAIPGVRRALVAKQRAIADRTSVVMEGRDIGTIVFPNADVKIYLDAQTDERISRRLREEQAKGAAIDPASLAREIEDRDRRDSTRAHSPLAQAPDAVYLDTTPLDLDEVEAAILKIVRDRVTNGKVIS
jgi:cytidylate kinase